VKPYFVNLLAGVSLLVLGSAAGARAAQPAQPQAAVAGEATLGEIVVTARRRSESLQEVPQTVNAVTADALQKLNIKEFADIQSVVPGLSLQADSTGYEAAASLRGVTFNVNSAAQPTVALYMNDAPVQANSLFHSLFDIGQVEVLKGPQGTTRGISAPSGAITITTRKPDLSEFGGYIDGTATDLQGRNLNGALNVPIIKDVLAVRLAGVIDQNRFDGVTSIHNSLKPQSTTSAERLSLSFEPSDVFDANVMYQHMDQSQTSFQQVSGPGSGAITYPAGVIPSGFPAGVNPPLSPTDRLSVQDSANLLHVHFDTVTAQIDSRIFGQHLSYVGSYQAQKINGYSEGGGSSAGDVGNVLPGIGLGQTVFTTQKVTTQEVRLASDPAPGRFIDYTVGAFYQWQRNDGHVNDPGPFLRGAFGTTPGVIDLGAFDPAYQVPLGIDIPSSLQETSLFGSVTLHLGDKTELSGGIRRIWSIVNSADAISVEQGQIYLGIPCSLAGLQAAAAAGACIIPAGPHGGAGNFTNRASETPNIYNVSLSHHLTRDVLLYANTGTSFRPAANSVGIQGGLAGDPVLHELAFRPSERSRAYEVGFKSTWLDGRARLNASVFRQRFTNLPVYIPGISYLNTITNQPTNFNFTAPVDALVQGFDVDTAFQVTPEWTISAQMSYADGKVKGSQVPCNVTGANGLPVYNTEGLISLCPGGSVSQLPLWNATFQSEYTHPISDGVDGFLRVLATYYPENRRVEPHFVVDAYSLVNLYLGLRSHDGAWEASIFARNALDAQRATDVQSVQTNLNTPLATGFAALIHPTGYYQTTMTAQREVGINLHYAWGER
jgi:iron complex outermembrane receptor protein